MRSMEEIEAELVMKARRVDYWETFHMLPIRAELIKRGEWQDGRINVI